MNSPRSIRMADGRTLHVGDRVEFFTGLTRGLGKISAIIVPLRGCVLFKIDPDEGTKFASTERWETNDGKDWNLVRDAGVSGGCILHVIETYTDNAGATWKAKLDGVLVASGWGTEEGARRAAEVCARARGGRR